MDISKRLKIITDSNKTVFRAKDLQALWGGSISANKIAITRMVKKGLITRIANGYYSLNENFNIYEFANLIISSSYISLNSALFYHGIASQVSNEVSSIASFNHEKKAQDLIYKYYVIKESILLNLEGIQHKNNIIIASPERAILDCLYFGILPNVADNDERIKTSYLEKLSKFYPLIVQKKVKKYI